MDIALAWDNALARADIAWAAADLAADVGLRTAILASLFTDARADDSADLPDPADTDRRGWWGDAFSQQGEAPGPSGSLLWLEARAFADEAARQRIEQHCRDALAWIAASGIAAAVDVASAWLSAGQLQVVIAIRRSAGQAQAERFFDFIWRAEGVI